MAFAVIETGGKQYRVTPGAVIKVEKIEAEVGSTITFDRVLAFAEGDVAEVSADKLKGKTVAAEVLDQGKGAKLHIRTYKAKKRQRRHVGHRQLFTQVKVLPFDGTAAAKPKKAAPAKPKAEKKPSAEA